MQRGGRSLPLPYGRCHLLTFLLGRRAALRGRDYPQCTAPALTDASTKEC